jgi:hypothetical protein
MNIAGEKPHPARSIDSPGVWQEAKGFLAHRKYQCRKRLITKIMKCCEMQRLHLAVDTVLCRLTLCISNDVTGIMLQMPLCT